MRNLNNMLDITIKILTAITLLGTAITAITPIIKFVIKFLRKKLLLNKINKMNQNYSLVY